MRKCKNCGPIYKVKRCVETDDKCVTNTKDRDKIGAKKGENLSEVLDKIDSALSEIECNEGTEYTFENIGEGKEILKTESNTEYHFRTIESDSIEVIENEDNIFLDIDIGIRSYVVNNNYTGQEKDGSEIRPFKTIKEAANKIIGDGDINNPEVDGAYIIVKSSEEPYIIDDTSQYDTRLSVKNMGIYIESNVIINFEKDEFFLDLDLIDNIGSHNVITMASKTSHININKGSGFRNKGRTNYVYPQKPKKIEIEGGNVNLNGNVYQSNRILYEGNIDMTSMLNNDSEKVPNILFKNTRIYSKVSKMFNIGRDNSVSVVNSVIQFSNKGEDIATKEDPVITVMNEGSLNTINTQYILYGSTSKPEVLKFSNIYKGGYFGLKHCDIDVRGLYVSFCKLEHELSVADFTHSNFRVHDNNRMGTVLRYVLPDEAVRGNNVSNINYCVTDTFNLTEGAIDYLNTNNKGRINTLNGHINAKLPEFDSYGDANGVLPKGSMFINRSYSSDPENYKVSVII